MLYFAYGSNMSSVRLARRTPSATALCCCRLSAHQLRFHKCGHDGSAKCDAYFTGSGEDSLWGVLYKLDPREKAVLDAVEGVGAGYEIKTVALGGEGSPRCEAFTYVATAIDASLEPFDWYLQHVVRGAREARLPLSYLRWLETTNSRIDPDPERSALEFAHYAGPLAPSGGGLETPGG